MMFKCLGFLAALLLLIDVCNADNADLENVDNQVEDHDVGMGNFTVDIKTKSRKASLKSFCCVFAAKHCVVPCIGRNCTDQCTVRCGFLGMFTCNPISCQVANPLLCTAVTTTTTASTTTCDSGWTQVGSKCYIVQAGPSNYYDAIAGCIALGGKLATIESQAEQDAVFALTGADGAYIGLQDFLDEGQFSWVDGTALGYTNWRPNGQPNNGNNNQHCVWIRPSSSSDPGTWDDITCKREEKYVCQK